MLTGIEFPEIFIGLVSPVGVDTRDTIAALHASFEKNDYNVIDIKVTSSFATLSKYINPDITLAEFPYADRINSYIKFGNQVRRHFDDNSILAIAAMSVIRELRWVENRRRKLQGKPPSFAKRVFLISQFKRPEEITVMRKAYGALFFQISIYDSDSARIKFLSDRIIAQRQFGDRSDPGEVARGLLATDENEADEPYGQRVGKIFHDADFIVSTQTNEHAVDEQIDRFVELLFGSNVISPTNDEYGLFAAKIAALRTLDLSRQVGAAIFSPSSEILAMGTNEVPKAGGGTYWSGMGYDARDYVLKVDPNELKKRLAVRELYGLFKQKPFEEEEFDEFISRENVKSSMIMDVIEYGRIVHAEMNALADAARLGHSVKGATLYTTTFPCHLCAKHIVAAGVERVVYLEPYPKSLAPELHSDSIVVDGTRTGPFLGYPAVEFQHFKGVTPRRYRELFERGKRKRGGVLQDYIDGVKKPIVQATHPYYMDAETIFVADGFGRLKRMSETAVS